MKKSFYNLALLALFSLVLVSCKKEIETSENNYATKTNPSSIQLTTKTGPKLTEIACIIENPDGEDCVGKKCSAAPGNTCGRVSNVCDCQVASKNFLPKNLTLDQFNELWQSENGRKELELMGYKEYDGEK